MMLLMLMLLLVRVLKLLVLLQDGGPMTAHTLRPGSPTYNVSLCGVEQTCSASPKHLLRVIVKSTTETSSRWDPQTTAVVFTGIVQPSAVPLVAPRRKQYVQRF